MSDPRLKVEDFAKAFGVTAAQIPRNCRALIDQLDFSYAPLSPRKRDDLILAVLKKIDLDQQIIGAPERHEVWQKGWAENLKDFVASGHDLKALVPKFLRPGQPVRWNQEFVLPKNPDFELDFVSVLRLWFFKQYFEKFSHVYEFGCGTGFNLVALAQTDPSKQLHGLDFAAPAVELVNTIGKAHGLNLRGHLFDMASPDESFAMEKDSAVFTFGALEQLAGRFEPFLQFLLKRSPGICLHIEPTVELYDADNLVDYLAIKFHKKRGYTENLLPRLRELEKEGKVEMIKVKRLFFGSLYMEGYSLIVWRPRR